MKAAFIENMLEFEFYDSSEVQLAKCVSSINWYFKEIENKDIVAVIMPYVSNSWINPNHFNVCLFKNKKITNPIFHWNLDKKLSEQNDYAIHSLYEYTYKISQHYKNKIEESDEQ